VDSGQVGVLLGLLALVISGPIGWIVRQAIADLRRLERDLNEQQRELTEILLEAEKRYVRKDDLHRELAEIKRMIERLFTKLDEQQKRMAVNRG